VIPSAAVFAAAIEDAEGLDHPGLVVTAMPISPSELFELRRQHAKETP
jgi:carbon-monoxide dehydrogenase large subunit